MALIREKGGWGPIFERVANGESVKNIAADYNTSRQHLSQQLNHPKRKDAYQETRHLGAAARLEDAEEMLQNAPHDRDALTKMKLILEHIRWKAGKIDREQWGDTPQTAVTLNIDSVFLDALKRVNRKPISAVVTVETARVALPAPESQ